MLTPKIVNELFYKTVMAEDFRSNTKENWMEMSILVLKLVRVSELSYDVYMGPDGPLFRGEFQFKIVHNLEPSTSLIYSEAPTPQVPDKYKEPEYLAFRYTSKNGRIRYVDWEGNPESWR